MCFRGVCILLLFENIGRAPSNRKIPWTCFFYNLFGFIFWIPVTINWIRLKIILFKYVYNWWTTAFMKMNKFCKFGNFSKCCARFSRVSANFDACLHFLRRPRNSDKSLCSSNFRATVAKKMLGNVLESAKFWKINTT